MSLFDFKSITRLVLMRDIYGLYDEKIVSDFRPEKTEAGYLIRVKRSKYITRIPTEPNEDIAYLAGVIAGDGYTNVSRIKGRVFPRVYITITNNSEEYLKALNNLFFNNFDYKGHIYKDRDKNCLVLKISNRVIVLYFMKFVGIPIDKSKLVIPGVFDTKKLVSNFIAGIFDTDGYFSQGTFRIMLSSRNTCFLEQIKNESKYFGIEFGKIGQNMLTVNGRNFYRASMRVKKKSVAAFLQSIPLKHERYGLAENRTPDLFGMFGMENRKDLPRL